MISSSQCSIGGREVEVGAVGLLHLIREEQTKTETRMIMMIWRQMRLGWTRLRVTRQV